MLKQSQRANYIDMLKEFIKTDFKLRYKNSILGFVWIILKPLALFSILYVVWTAMYKIPGNNRLFLFIGLILVYYFNDGINLGILALINKAHIILKINFPKEIVIFSTTLVAFINFAINLLVVIVFAFFNPVEITFASLMLFIFAILTLQILIIAVSFFTSIWNIRFRDLHHITELFLQVVFWATPILYQIESLPPKYQTLIKLNPLTHIIKAARMGLLSGKSVTLESFVPITILFIAVCLLSVAGYFYFKNNVTKVAEFF